MGGFYLWPQVSILRVTFVLRLTINICFEWSRKKGIEFSGWKIQNKFPASFAFFLIRSLTVKCHVRSQQNYHVSCASVLKHGSLGLLVCRSPPGLLLHDEVAISDTSKRKGVIMFLVVSLVKTHGRLAYSNKNVSRTNSSEQQVST